MARSIGDHAVSAVGVIAEPVVTKHKVAPNDEFLILASDGVREFISSQETVDIVGEHLDRGATKACQALIEAAAAKWHEEEGDYRDDDSCASIGKLAAWWTTRATIIMKQAQDFSVINSSNDKSRFGSMPLLTASGAKSIESPNPPAMKRCVRNTERSMIG
jgi:serine/threonine protein phosphatase PrpC